MSHVCHAIGCSAQVPPRRLMCLPHWRLVSVDLQKRVWAAYVSGQEERKDPSPEYVAAAKAAIALVDRIQNRGRLDADLAGRVSSLRAAVEGCTLTRTEDGVRVESMFKGGEEK